MSITLKEQVGPQIPSGAHIAICHRICDIGTQTSEMFGLKRKIVIFWELPHERVVFEGVEKPLGISKIYTVSLNKKANLRKDLVGWRGRDFTADELKGFELKAILGKPCQLSIEHNEEGRAKVGSVIGLPKGMQVPGTFNPLVEWSIDDGKGPVYDKLPDWVKTMADACLEWAPKDETAPGHVSTPAAESTDNPPEDDIPF